MSARASLRLLLSALTAVGVVASALQLSTATEELPVTALSPQTALSGATTHTDPLPDGVSLADPTDTASLYARAGVDRSEVVRRARARVDRAGRNGAVTGAEPSVASSAVPPGTPTTVGLSSHAPPSCSGTGTDGKRVQPLYVREATTPSRHAALLPLLLHEVANVDDVFALSAQKSGGVRRVRWVHASCVPVLPEVVVPPGSLASFAATMAALNGLGYNDPNRKYLAFAEAQVLCGIGTLYDDTRPVGNLNDARTSYARVDAPCWSSRTSVAAHELTHNLGGVLSTAPHQTVNSHCWDESDLMCYEDGSGVAMQTFCADADHGQLLDCNGDDYFSTAPAEGSWLAQNWNTARSEFLDTTAPAFPPPTTTVVRPTTPSPARTVSRTRLDAGWQGRQRLVTGRLREGDGTGVARARVTLQRRAADGRRWVDVGHDRTDRRGKVTERQKPRGAAYYRWVYDGSPQLLGSRSDRVKARTS